MVIFQLLDAAATNGSTGIVPIPVEKLFDADDDSPIAAIDNVAIVDTIASFVPIVEGNNQLIHVAAVAAVAEAAEATVYLDCRNFE